MPRFRGKYRGINRKVTIDDLYNEKFRKFLYYCWVKRFVVFNYNINSHIRSRFVQGPRNCNLVYITKVLHFQRREDTQWLHIFMQTKYLYGHAIKGMDDNLPFQGFFVFFKRSILSGISISNRHLLILDGHGSHVKSNWTSKSVWARYGDFIFACIACTLTFGHGLFQTFQEYFQKRKRHING